MRSTVPYLVAWRGPKQRHMEGDYRREDFVFRLSLTATTDTPAATSLCRAQARIQSSLARDDAHSLSTASRARSESA